MKLNKPLKLPKIISNLRLRHQILLIQLFCLIMITIITTICLFTLLTYGSNLISIIAQDVLIKKILSRYANEVTHYYHRRVYQGFIASERQLIYMNQLYRATIQQNNCFEYNVDEGLLRDYTNFTESISYYNSFPFGIFGQKINETYYYDKLLLSDIMTEYILLMPQKALLYFTSITTEQYFSINPGGYYNGYVPHSRPWYKNHLNQMNLEQFPVSDPYPNYLGGMCITKTANLTNQQNEFVGIVANDMNMTSFWGINNISDIQIQLIDMEGELILSTVYVPDSNKVEYFYNVSVLGYNFTDYMLIINQTNNYNQICPINLEGWNCLNNKKDNLTYYIKSSKILQYAVIISFNSNSFTQQFIMLNNIENQLKQNQINFIFINYAIIIIIFIIIQIAGIQIIQIPLERIMIGSFLIAKTNSISSKLKGLIHNNITNTQLGKLSSAFSHLIDNKMFKMLRKTRIKSFDLQPSYLRNYFLYPLNFYPYLWHLSDQIKYNQWKKFLLIFKQAKF